MKSFHLKISSSSICVSNRMFYNCFCPLLGIHFSRFPYDKNVCVIDLGTVSWEWDELAKFARFEKYFQLRFFILEIAVCILANIIAYQFSRNLWNICSTCT